MKKQWIFDNQTLAQKTIEHISKTFNQDNIHNHNDFLVEGQSFYSSRSTAMTSLEDMFEKFKNPKTFKNHYEIYINKKKIKRHQETLCIDDLFLTYFSVSHFNQIEDNMIESIKQMPTEEKKLLLKLNNQDFNNFLWNSYPYNLVSDPYYQNLKESKNPDYQSPYSKTRKIVYSYLNPLNELIKEIIHKEDFSFLEASTPEILEFKKKCLIDICSIDFDFPNTSLKTVLEDAGSILKNLTFFEDTEKLQNGLDHFIDKYDINLTMKLIMEKSLLEENVVSSTTTKIKTL